MNLQSLMGPGAWEHYRPSLPETIEQDVTRHCFRESNCSKHQDHIGPLCCCCGQPAEAHTGCDCEPDLAETVRQAMSDWDGATPDQRADALRKAGEAAGRDEICVMDWNRCTEKCCDLYASGCPHTACSRCAGLDTCPRPNVPTCPAGYTY